MSLFTKQGLTSAEFVLKHTLINLGMRKCPDEKIKKMRENDELW